MIRVNGYTIQISKCYLADAWLFILLSQRGIQKSRIVFKIKNEDAVKVRLEIFSLAIVDNLNENVNK